MGLENPLHLLFIGVVALLVLGPRRLPEVARALGRGVREFREAMSQGAASQGAAQGGDARGDGLHSHGAHLGAPEASEEHIDGD